MWTNYCIQETLGKSNNLINIYLKERPLYSGLFLIYYICNVLIDFNKYIDQQHLCVKEDRILVAVSGGIDSMVMLDLFLRSGYQLAVAHCNFQLRGKASEEDAFFVEKVGQKHGLKVFTKNSKHKNMLLQTSYLFRKQPGI